MAGLRPRVLDRMTARAWREQWQELGKALGQAEASPVARTRTWAQEPRKKSSCSVREGKNPGARTWGRSLQLRGEQGGAQSAKDQATQEMTHR